MSMSISERFKVIALALSPDADRYNTSPSTDWIKVDYSILFLISEGAGGVGEATITANNASTNTGTGTAPIAFRYRLMTTAGGLDTWSAFAAATSSGVLVAAGAEKATIVELRFDELDDGKPWVNLTLTESTDGAVDAGVVAFVDSGRGGDAPPSIL